MKRFYFFLLQGGNFWSFDAFSRKVQVLVQLPSTTSDTELDYDHQKANTRVTSRVPGRFKT